MVENPSEILLGSFVLDHDNTKTNQRSYSTDQEMFNMYKNKKQ
jgi:hypothetical protein